MRQLRFRTAVCLSVATAGYLAMSTLAAYARSAVQRDVEGYAIASCLYAQKEPYLKEQGDGWASAIVQRSNGSLDALTAVGDAVKAELAKGDMAIIRNEAEPMKGLALPVMYCGEIIDEPSVHAAIAKAVKTLAASYRPH
jgi:hypothetical protein